MMLSRIAIVYLSLVFFASTEDAVALTTTVTPSKNNIKVADSNQLRDKHNNEFVADVGIVGAGPAGLTLCHALRERGYSVQIFERRSSFRPVGAALFMYPFALTALGSVSPKLEQNLRKVATPIRKISVNSLSQENSLIGSDKIDDAEDTFGAPFSVVKYWDMIQALRDDLPDSIFNFGYEIQGFDQDKDGGGVLIQYKTLEEGDEAYSIRGSSRVKILIDAGGIRSKVRNQLIGDTPIPRFKATFAVAPADGIQNVLGANAHGDRELAFNAAEGVTMLTATLKNGDVWWTQTDYKEDLATSSTTSTPSTAYQRFDGTSSSSIRQELKERFDMWPDELRGLVYATSSDEIIETKVSELPISWKWGEDDVTLVGDAAHAALPSLGLGVSVAFSDVAELCKQIDKFGLDRKALRWYEFVRIPQTAAIQLATRFVNSISMVVANL